MNEERTGKCLRQVEHIRGYLWHITVNQVMVATVKFTTDMKSLKIPKRLIRSRKSEDRQYNARNKTKIIIYNYTEK